MECAGTCWFDLLASAGAVKRAGRKRAVCPSRHADRSNPPEERSGCSGSSKPYARRPACLCTLYCGLSWKKRQSGEALDLPHATPWAIPSWMTSPSPYAHWRSCNAGRYQGLPFCGAVGRNPVLHRVAGRMRGAPRSPWRIRHRLRAQSAVPLWGHRRSGTPASCSKLPGRHRDWKRSGIPRCIGRPRDGGGGRAAL